MPWLLCAMLLTADAGEVDFDTEVAPLFSKLGCNAAACHGSAAGRGGFRLSLFGGEPAQDYDAIVRQLEGRRVNLAHPEDSLLLAKPTGQLEHEGGVRFEYDGDEAGAITAWLSAGANRSLRRSLKRLRVEPPQMVVDALPAERSVRVIASFFDHRLRREVDEDVTRLAAYTSTDAGAVDIDEAGGLQVLRRGQHVVLVRFLSQVRTVLVVAPMATEEVELAAAPRHNWIDDEVLNLLATLRLPAAMQADDATRLRRVTLSLTGRLPTEDEVRRFSSDERPDRFARRVDELLATDQFDEYWTFQLAKWLRLRAQPGDQQGAVAFHHWLHDQLRRRVSLAEMARALLTAEGDSHQYGPANLDRQAEGPREQAEYVSEVLMGVRLRCANCHNHPLDRWTQDDYHGLAAVFAKIERGRFVKVKSDGEVDHPGTGQPARQRIPGERFVDGGGDARLELAAWLTAERNPYFARAFVNRLWKTMMGRGLIEPVDDLRDTNPATHPRLLANLAEDFVEHGYDLRHVLRQIARSAAYQRDFRPAAGAEQDDRFYSHFLSTPLEAEVLLDAIVDITGVPESFGDSPSGRRAVALVDPDTPSLALDVLGRCSRTDSCETSAGSAGGGLTARLHLLNGRLINRKLEEPKGRLHQLIERGASNDDIVATFYIRAFGRQPRAAERDYWLAQLDGDGDERARRLADFVWSLLNCREFQFNH